MYKKFFGRDFPDVWTACCAGAGWGLGWLLAIVAIAAIRERLQEYSNIPNIATPDNSVSVPVSARAIIANVSISVTV